MPMDPEDKLPRTAYALIELLDEITFRPEMPTSKRMAGDCRADLDATLFDAGARALVDTLVAEMQEELRDAEERAEERLPGDGPGTVPRVSDEPKSVYPQVFGPDGEVRQTLPPILVDI